MSIPTEANIKEAREIIRRAQCAAYPNALEKDIAQALANASAPPYAPVPVKDVNPDNDSPCPKCGAYRANRYGHYSDSCTENPVDAAQTSPSDVVESPLPASGGLSLDETVEEMWEAIRVTFMAIAQGENLTPSCVRVTLHRINMIAAQHDDRTRDLLDAEAKIREYDRKLLWAEHDRMELTRRLFDCEAQSAPPVSQELSAAQCIECGHDKGWLGKETKTCQKPGVMGYPGTQICGCKCVFPDAPVSQDELERILAEIEARTAKVPAGPYFVTFDDAEECGPHKNSGLAKVDTGRSADWPIARLCEWPTAEFIKNARTDIPRLIQLLRERVVERDAEEKDKVLVSCWKALRELPKDALGHDPESGWYYRDELLAHVERLLPAPSVKQDQESGSAN